MDTPITRAEHEEFRRTVNESFQRIDDEDRRQNHRIELCEENGRQLTSLATSVEKLAVNMGNMVKTQEQQNAHLEKHDEEIEEIKGRDGEMWRKVVGYLITALIGAVVGMIGAQLGL